MKISGF